MNFEAVTPRMNAARRFNTRREALRFLSAVLYPAGRGRMVEVHPTRLPEIQRQGRRYGTITDRRGVRFYATTPEVLDAA